MLIIKTALASGWLSREQNTLQGILCASSRPRRLILNCRWGLDGVMVGARRRGKAADRPDIQTAALCVHVSPEVCRFYYYRFTLFVLSAALMSHHIIISYLVIAARS